MNEIILLVVAVAMVILASVQQVRVKRLIRALAESEHREEYWFNEYGEALEEIDRLKGEDNDE